MTSLDIWRVALTSDEIAGMANCSVDTKSLRAQDKVVAWDTEDQWITEGKARYFTIQCQ